MLFVKAFNASNQGVAAVKRRLENNKNMELSNYTG
jgi:hypothetical protein